MRSFRNYSLCPSFYLLLQLIEYTFCCVTEGFIFYCTIVVQTNPAMLGLYIIYCFLCKNAKIWLFFSYNFCFCIIQSIDLLLRIDINYVNI